MNLGYLGDALDHWKGSLFDYLSGQNLLTNFAVDPLAPDGRLWTPDDFALFARLLRVEKYQILRHRSPFTERRRYFQEIVHRGDLFLDPDTGIDTGGGSPASKYVKPSELASLLQIPEGRVIAVYQHVRAQKTCDRVDACIRRVADMVRRMGWCSYESGTVAMLFLSQRPARTAAIAEGFGNLLNRHVEGRVRGGIIEPQ